jgi:hypothetical protein
MGRTGVSWVVTRALLASLLTGALFVATSRGAVAQTPQGATLTVESGQVGVLQARGGATQPAPSGMTLAVGDQVATIGRSTALLTFFEGSELELGEGTTVILREIRSAGTEVHVSVEDVLGTAVGRVTAFANPSSSFSVTSPGGHVVALIHGSAVRMTVYESGSVFVEADHCTITCEIRIDGNAAFSGTGNASFSVDQNGGVTQGNNSPDQSEPRSSNGINNGGNGGGGGSGGSENEGGGGGGGGGYGYRGNDSTTLELLRDHLANLLSPLANGWPAAVGMIGWGLYGYRPGRRP